MKRPGDRVQQRLGVIEVGNGHAARDGEEPDQPVADTARPAQAMRCDKISSKAASARARNSSSVRSWMGWGTNTAAAGNPSSSDWAAAPVTNSSDARKTAGTPRL